MATLFFSNFEALACYKIEFLLMQSFRVLYFTISSLIHLNIPVQRYSFFWTCFFTPQPLTCKACLVCIC